MFELDETRRDALLEGWARRIVQRGWGSLAVLALEAHKPLASLGAHVVLAFQPLLDALLPVNAGELAAFLYQPENVERLTHRIEQLTAEREESVARTRRRRAAARQRVRRWRALRRRCR